MPYTPIFDDIDLPPVESEVEAEHRARYFQRVDPFQEIDPALLWSKHFVDYVRVTAMLYPFYPKAEDGRVKSASYEARPGRTFIRWTPEGRKQVEPIEQGKDKKFVLPKNSITFMQIESTIRLPEYIALRFNLRITHVHRGLLLGTGPLVDPQFEGNLLIPLHNLTDQDYELSQDEGLIWIEFTKTSRRMPAEPHQLSAQEQGRFVIEPYKKNRGPEYYFEKANNNNPIRSSIEGIVVEAKNSQVAAEAAAKKALYYSRLFATIGFLAIAAMVLSTVVALHQYFGQIGSLAQSVQDKASTALGRVDQAIVGADEARKSVEEARKEIQSIRDELQQLRNRQNLQPPTAPSPRQ